MSEMNNPNTMSDAVPDTKTVSSLPKAGKKAPPLYVYAFMIIVLGVIAYNSYFTFNRDTSHSTSSDEQFNVDAFNAKNQKAGAQSGHANDAGFALLDKEKAAAAEKEASLNAAIQAAKAKDFIDRLQVAQSAAVSGGSNSTNVATVNQAGSGAENNAANVRNDDPNSAYMVSVSNDQPVRSFAGKLIARPWLIGQGKFIFATLSVGIHSDLPGQVTAIINQDVYGETGRQVLIPRGSRLVGEYKSGLSNNQSRVFVVWTRILTTNGFTIQIGSEGTDALGQAGMTGAIDYHFITRYGSASLISLLGAGASNVGVGAGDENNASSQYRQAVTQALNQTSASILEKTINIPPTVRVKQGERVVVFVNRDLDFSRVLR